MNPVVLLLLDLTARLAAAPGVSADALRALRIALAATLLQDNPALANIDVSDLEPWVAEALAEGLIRANALRQAGTRLRVVRDDIPLGAPFEVPSERPAVIHGPFVEPSGQLAEFRELESGRFLSVRDRLPFPPIPGPTWLLIPIDSQPQGDNLTWKLPAGTVWIQASRLVANAAGFAAVRIAGGELQFDQPATQNPGEIVASRGTPWSLRLQPEQPAAGDPIGSDADAVVLTLPATIEIRNGGVAVIVGDVSCEGFGSPLVLRPAAAAVRLDRGQIAFPLDVVDAPWSIGGNRSPVTQFSGGGTVTQPSYALPLLDPFPIGPAEALHGGSLVARIQPGLTSTLAGQRGGPNRWFDATLTANAQQLEIDALQVDSAARYDVELWSGVTSRFVFAQTPIHRLLFRSNRDGRDAVTILGGKIRNLWDLPRRADGRPFAFEGSIELFALLSDASGLHLACVAAAPPQNDLAGIALENLYVKARPPSRMSLLAHGAGVPVGASGTATLLFDAVWAIPILPDPYAWNLPHTDFGGLVEHALRIVLTWEAGQQAAVSAHLDQPVAFPGPPLAQPPNDDDARLHGQFISHLRCEHEQFLLLDLSSREHLFGVALEHFDQQPTIVDNRLTVALRQVRLLMQPQVQWEPVADVTGVLRSTLNGGPTLAGAHSVTLVPVLPGVISTEIPRAIAEKRPAAALFSLPFGLRAFVRLGPPEDVDGLPARHGVETTIHEPAFESLQSARQIRLRATGEADPSREMPGTLVQLANVAGGVLPSVMPPSIRDGINLNFATVVPLHQADLSGYGLSSFSNWSNAVADVGIVKATFHVLNGRTAFEVIQQKSICWPSQATFVRTIVLERHNSGTVVRTDSGWVAVTPGLYNRYIPFEKGVVRGLNDIRRIRITGPDGGVPLGPASAGGQVVVQSVLFDADAEFEDLVGGAAGRVPVADQVGYMQLSPVSPFTPQDLRLLFSKVGPIGGPVNGRIRAGKTIAMQLSSLLADHAPTDANAPGFAIAAFGSPKLPGAGQWSVVRIDPATFEAAPVDPRRGTPISRLGAGPYQFREAADVRRTPRTMYGFLMSTDTSRAMFPQPRIEPAQPGALFSDKPLLADPYSLCQASGAFPRPAFALRAHQAAIFDVTADDDWRIQDPSFTFDKPLPDLLKGGEWGMNRAYDALPLRLNVDSTIPAPWDIAVPPANLDIDIPPFGTIMTIRTQYIADAAGVPKLDEPSLLFSGALAKLKETLDALEHLIDLPFHADVTVTAAGAGSLSFIVRIKLRFRLAEGPNERIDIGIGKFYGEFLIDGELEAAPSGVRRGRLLAQFTGDLQQGVLPPLIYAGGLFRFAVEIRDSGRPVVELTFAAVISIGGDLVKNLIEVEVTVKYGYTLIPETLEPGVFLGLEVRAKLIGGLFGFSFAAEVMARVARTDPHIVKITARIRVVATVQVAFFLEDDVDFETEFEQELPLTAVALIGGVNPLAAVAAGAVL